MTDWAEAWHSLVDGGDARVMRRLHKGEQYHRAGRVSDLRVAAGFARVRVQGDRATPLAVEVRVPTLDDAAWETVVTTLAGQVRHTARLLAGHAPEGLDADLVGTGVRIVPTRDEVEVTCDCGDDTWPCGHAAALWSVLEEAIDTDPFVLLRLRGRGRERLLAELAAARRQRGGREQSSGVAIADLDTARWTAARAPLEDVTLGEPPQPRTSAGTLRLLGDPPGWEGGVDAWKLFSPLVERAAAWVADLEDE